MEQGRVVLRKVQADVDRLFINATMTLFDLSDRHRLHRHYTTASGKLQNWNDRLRTAHTHQATERDLESILSRTIRRSHSLLGSCQPTTVKLIRGVVAKFEPIRLKGEHGRDEMGCSNLLVGIDNLRLAL